MSSQHKLVDDEMKRQRVAQRIREMSQKETKGNAARLALVRVLTLPSDRDAKRIRVIESLPANKKARTTSYPGNKSSVSFNNQIKNRPSPAAIKVAPKAGMNLLQLSKLQAKKKKGHL
jgi:hypothetical protein